MCEPPGPQQLHSDGASSVSVALAKPGRTWISQSINACARIPTLDSHSQFRPFATSVAQPFITGMNFCFMEKNPSFCNIRVHHTVSPVIACFLFRLNACLFRSPLPVDFFSRFYRTLSSQFLSAFETDDIMCIRVVVDVVSIKPKGFLTNF